MKKIFVVLIFWGFSIFGQENIFFYPTGDMQNPVENHILYRVNVNINPSVNFQNGVIGKEWVEIELLDNLLGVPFTLTLSRTKEMTFSKGPVESLWFGVVDDGINRNGKVMNSYIARTVNGKYYSRVYYDNGLYVMFPENVVTGSPVLPSTVYHLQKIDPLLMPEEEDLHYSLQDEFSEEEPVQIGTHYNAGTDYEINGLIGIAPEVYEYTNYTLEQIAMKMTGDLNSTFINTGINNVKITLQFENLQCPDSDPDCTNCTSGGFFCEICSNSNLLSNPGDFEDNDSKETCQSTYRWNYIEMWQYPCTDQDCVNKNRKQSYCGGALDGNSTPNPYVGHLHRCPSESGKGLSEYVGAGFTGIVTYYRFVQRNSDGSAKPDLNGDGSYWRHSLISRAGSIMDKYIISHEFGHILNIQHTAESRARSNLFSCNGCSCEVKEKTNLDGTHELGWDCAGTCDTGKCQDDIKSRFNEIITPGNIYYNPDSYLDSNFSGKGRYYIHSYANISGGYKFYTVTGKKTEFLDAANNFFERHINAFSRSDIHYCDTSLINPVCGQGGDPVYADAYHFLTQPSTTQTVPGNPVTTITINNITVIDDLATRYKLVCPVKEKWCADNDRDGACDDRLTVIEVCRGDDPNDSGTNTNYISDNGTIDNCRNNYNSVVSYSLKDELISGENGAIIKRLGRLGTVSSGFTWRYVYKMQPDSDLDGIGDACDFTSAGNGSDGFANSRITNAKPKTIIPPISDPLLFLSRTYNHYAEINLSMPVGSGRESSYCTDSFTGNIYKGSSCNAAIHYCAIDFEQKERELWGTPGYCTVAGDSSNIFQHGYSHGSDNFDIYSRTSWRSRISVVDSIKELNYLNWSEFIEGGEPNDDPARKPVINSNTSFKLIGSENGTIWNWRRDWYEKKKCNDPDNSGTAECQSLKTAAPYNAGHTMYYTLSTSILPVVAGTPNESIPRYLITVNNKTLINPAYFPSTNTNVNARAARYKTDPMELNFHMKLAPWLESIELPEIKNCSSCYWNIPIENILNEQGMPEAFSINHIGRWLTGKDESGNYMMNSQHLYFPENMTIFSEMTEHAMVAVRTVETPATGETEYQLLLNTSENGADWEFLGNISNWDSEISSIRAIVSNDSGMYFIARLGDLGRHLFRVSVNGDVPEITDPENLPKITYSLHDLGLTGIGDDILEDEKLISVEGSLFVIGADSAGAGTRTFKSASGEAPFTEITGLSPASRKIYNLKAAGKYIFLTGGMNANNGSMTDIWRFDTESEEWAQVPFSLVGDFRKVITQFVDGKLVMANPVMTGNLTHPAFEIDPDIADINDLVESIDYVEIPVTEAVYESMDTYCLNETDSIVKGGLEISGECVPFTHPWYRSFATGSTIYSVAGKGDRLYVGTNNSIKVYDISDPNALVLKSTFSTGGRIVYDLEVADDDVMYAATSGGIYKLNTANPDTLASLSFFATSYNYQYRIQLYNDKLYVGDDNGINIRDKETFTRLAYINIDSVLDFAIANGEIALYRSSFWSAGLHIRDVETLNLKAYEYAECYTGELTTDHGAFYLSCDGYEYRFEGRPDTYFNFYPLDGDIREMQENHVYNGWTYIPDGSNVKLSTLNDVPSYCGNGVIEEGELCDGNSVACTTLDPDYTGGSAACNSTCNGYNESNCSTDGW